MDTPMVRSASDETHLWFTHDATKSVLRVPIDAPGFVYMSDAGSPVVTFATGSGPASDLVVDATHVHWLTAKSSGVLHRVAKTGGPVETLVDDVRKGMGLAADAVRICWGEVDLDRIRCLAK